jgi:hypothetical protein
MSTLYVHGLPHGYGWLGASHRLHDGTLGCIAVTDAFFTVLVGVESIGQYLVQGGAI